MECVSLSGYSYSGSFCLYRILRYVFKNPGSLSSSKLVEWADRIQALEREWIPVSERLPDFTVKVLAYWRPIDHKDRPFHREIIIAERTPYEADDSTYNLDSRQWWANGRYYDTETVITHWMPLPAPPDNAPLGEK